jgi:DNA uptake protein ComE-like DNA-binding protein
MGINDRDYMRRSDSEPAEAPRSIAREGVTLAVCIVIGMLIVGGGIRRNTTEKEKEMREVRAAEEQLQSLLVEPPIVVMETPPKLRRLVNVNTATFDELQTVPYVGEVLAGAIISHKPYGTLDELDKAPGIGKRKIEMLRPYLTAE